MTSIKQLSPEFVDFIPEKPEQGIIYISLRFSTALHLCCCGCGLEVVTPLNPAKWQLTRKNDFISLYPSIGNWGFPCQSHYWIDSNRILWAEAMSSEVISAVKARDRKDAELLSSKKAGLLTQCVLWLEKLWQAIQKAIKF